MPYHHFAFVFLIWMCFPLASIAQKDDAFLRGYVSAVLQKVHNIPEAKVTVQQGQITIENVPDDKALRGSIQSDLLAVEGVREIRFGQADESGMNFLQKWERKLGRSEAYSGFFPGEDLFNPLFTDPFQSRVSLNFRPSETSNSEFGAVSLGEVFGLYRWDQLFGGDHTIQLNVESNVSAYFDLEAPNTELNNVDFQVGVPIVYRYNEFSTRLRLMHRSSHLGDEFIGNRALNRTQILDSQADENFSDLIFSYEKDWWRVFLGGTYKYDVDPERDPWDIQYGFELTPWNENSIHPIAGVWIRQQGEFGWAVDQRYVAGFAFEDFPFKERSMKILGEYYKGKSLQAPFFQEGGDFYGVEISFDF